MNSAVDNSLRNQVKVLSTMRKFSQEKVCLCEVFAWLELQFCRSKALTCMPKLPIVVVGTAVIKDTISGVSFSTPRFCISRSTCLSDLTSFAFLILPTRLILPILDLEYPLLARDDHEPDSEPQDLQQTDRTEVGCMRM